MAKQKLTKEEFLEIFDKLPENVTKKILIEAEKYLLDLDFQNATSDLIDKLDKKLDECKTEEEIHRFLYDNQEIIMDNSPSYGNKIISGIISKFPITPDRIVDFFLFEYKVGISQGVANVIKIIELKKPDSKIFIKNGRMSQELNDAWMECSDAIRLCTLNYKDIIRRSAKSIEPKIVLSKKDRWKYKSQSEGDGRISAEHPLISTEIYIGRRGMLTKNNLDRFKGLSRNHAPISVHTYDHLVDRLEIQRDRRKNKY